MTRGACFTGAQFKALPLQVAHGCACMPVLVAFDLLFSGNAVWSALAVQHAMACGCDPLVPALCCTAVDLLLSLQEKYLHMVREVSAYGSKSIYIWLEGVSPCCYDPADDAVPWFSWLLLTLIC